MSESLGAEVRRLWGGDFASSRLKPDDLRSELIRTVSAASAIAKDQDDRVDKLSLPLVSLNVFETKSNPVAVARRFLDQIRSDYRRVSPRFDLEQIEKLRCSSEGEEVLKKAHVDNQSLGVLAVGELLDSPLPVETLEQWIGFNEAPTDSWTEFASVFGAVLGPIVHLALASRYEPRPPDSPDFGSYTEDDWASQFIAAGAEGLLHPGLHTVWGAAPAG